MSSSTGKQSFLKQKTFKIYFDGSLQAIGVSVVCLSELPNGQKIYRLLCNKGKILGNDVNTAPRSELCACLVSTRVYTLIMEQLKDFLENFKGCLAFAIACLFNGHFVTSIQY